MKTFAIVSFFALLAVVYSVYGQDIDCPFPTGSELPNLIPQPKNCSEFYDCTTGYPFLKACPKNLHFNDIKKVCDYPTDACCDLRYDPKHKCPNNPAN